MRIVQLEPANVGGQGDHIYRTAQPLRALCDADPRVRAVSGAWLSPAIRAAAEVADLLVLAKVADPDLLGLLTRRQAAGLASVYEINDDFTAVQPWNPTARFFAQPENRSLVTQLARRAEGLQFSSRGLQTKFQHLHTEQRLWPNQLASMPEERSWAPAERVIIGWGGSYGHRDDLAAVTPALLAVLDARPQVDLAVMGDPRLRPLFGDVDARRLHFVETGPLSAYERFLSGLDIGIAPLQETAFNVGRSDVKYLEYAAHGVAPVCAAGVTYGESLTPGENGLLFSTPAELEAHLVALVDQADVRLRLARQAYRHVTATRTQANQAPAQLAWYRSLTARGQATTTQAPDAFEDALSSVTGEGHARYLAMPLAPGEQHLYNALVSQADPKQARRDCLAARRASPDNFLATMHLARFDGAERAPKHFARAAAQHPTSAALHWLWANWAAARGAHDQEAQQLQTTLTHAPDYAPALVRLGALREAQANDAEAEAHYRHSLAANPDYHVAALVLATLWARQGRTRDAETLLAEHESQCQDDPRYWQLRGRLALVHEQPEQAVDALSRCLGPDGSPASAAGSGTPLAHESLALLAKAYAMSGRLAEARETLGRLNRA